MNNLSISIIMPALNEEKNIANAVRDNLAALKKFGFSGEIIVVNDGSDDGTKAIVEGISKENSHVVPLNHTKPVGIGRSFWDGVRRAKNDIVVMIPGDNENNPEDALKFLSLMKEVDIIVPFIHNVEVRDRKRRFISSLYRFIINISFGINLNYTNGTVFYRRSILDGIELKSRGFFYQTELLVKLIRKGYLFAEVPNFLSVRRGGKSKAMTMRSLLAVIKDYLRLFFEVHIKRIESKETHRRVNDK